MSSSAVAYPAPIDLQEPKPPTVTPDSILTDPRLSRYFAALSDHYSSLMSEMERDANLLKYFGKVVYLIDADVLRNIVEVSYKDDLLRRETQKLFENPNFHYALPLGAFQELVEWLRGYVPDGLSLWDTDIPGSISGNLTGTGAVKSLAKAFGISIEGSTSLDLMEKVIATLEHEGLDIERLIELLTKPNCFGVVGDFDEGDVAALNLIIEELPRGSARTERRSPQRQTQEKALRTKKDHRDAVNLAIAFKSCRIRENRGTGAAKNIAPTHVLVTQTHLLLDLVRRANERGDDSVQKLSSLLNLPGPQVVDGMYPVLSPRRAFIVEEFRREHSFENHALRELKGLKRDYEDLGGALRDAAHAVGTKKEAQAISGAIRRKLEHLKIIYAQDPFYRRLEQSRATEMSIQYLREKLKPGSVTAVETAATLELAAESFFRILRRSYALLEEKAVTTYSAKRELDDSCTFEAITVLSDRPTELLLEGEVYRRRSDSAEAAYQGYSFRWPTSCTERQFFAAIDSIVRLTDQRRPSRKAIQLQCMMSFDDVREGGLLIFTNVGVYGSPFGKLPENLALKDISLELLRVGIASVFGENHEEVVLQAVRVCTQFGDFQLDLDSNEFGGREVFVISHYNIGRQIVHLCESTCLFTVLPVKLDTLLQKEVTAHFPLFPNRVDPIAQ